MKAGLIKFVVYTLTSLSHNNDCKRRKQYSNRAIMYCITINRISTPILLSNKSI